MSAYDPKRTFGLSVVCHFSLPPGRKVLAFKPCTRRGLWEHMQRRDFIKVIAGSVVAWPLAARAQQPTMPVIGFMNAASAQSYTRHLSAFLKGLAETDT
jgi:hypothetical protein